MKKALLLFLLMSAICIAQNENYKQLDRFFDVLYQNDKIMGTMTIMKDGKVVYSKSTGYQYINKKNKKEASSQSKYRIGSVTKTFTATMIFQLVDEGKIKLDNILSDYFPKVANASNIKISNLLDHSSGLYNITNDKNFSKWMLEPSTTEDMLSRIVKYDIDFQPGEKHEYSNTNFILLGYILEMIEGKNYGELLRERIAVPLSLKNTYYGDVIDINADECLSYIYEDDASMSEADQTEMSNPGGAGGIVSNPSDLVVFVDALFNGKLMSADSFNAMTTIKADEYGSGILSAKKEGLTLYAHNGRIDFFQSVMVYIPELKAAIALNANALDYDLMPIMFNAIGTVMGRDISIPSFNSLELTEAQVKQYEGVYESKELPFDLVFEAHGRVLKGAPEGSNLKNLTSTKKNEFTLDQLGIVLNFDIEKETVLFARAGNPTILFNKK